MVSLAAIPALPLFGAILLKLAGRRLPHPASGALASATVLGSFVLSLLTVLNGPANERLGEWLPINGADWALQLGTVNSMMILVISGIGFLIHLYSIGYMADDPGYPRFFASLNLFVFFMLLLVLADNYALLFVGWEGVGLCSYLLIGYYLHRRSAGDAAKKAFVVNRIGDAFFIIGMFLWLAETGTLEFAGVNTAPISSATALCLFAGAAGKSAQFPLYVWLPDAMEGPTPVSALIHAATMVTAGVYVMAITPLPGDVLPVIAAIGAFTAIFAASVALVQNDIKRVLAYSTVSQLGYMFMAIGTGAAGFALFHLLTHAFFKALLFLGAGSVIHGLNGEQDLRKMGGLRRSMPFTHATLLIGTLAIAGVPGLSGFFSKDDILIAAWSSSKLLYAAGLVTAAMTACYMWRMLTLAFHGEPRSQHHAHESPAVMTVPLGALALGSIAAGWPSYPFLSQVPVQGGEKWMLMAFAVTATVLGILLSRFAVSGRLERILANGWYVDRALDFAVSEVLAKRGGALLGRFDRDVIDGGVNGAAWLARLTSRLSIFWDTWVVDGAVRLTGFIVHLAGYPVRLAHTGKLQQYALFFVFGIILILGAYVTR